MIFFPLLLPQLMQQQAALMASVAQGGYLNPMAAFAAAQMQQMAALNMNGLAAAPMTPTSGEPPGTNTGPGPMRKLLGPGRGLISDTSGSSWDKSTWCLGPSEPCSLAVFLNNILISEYAREDGMWAHSAQDRNFQGENTSDLVYP